MKEPSFGLWEYFSLEPPKGNFSCLLPVGLLEHFKKRLRTFFSRVEFRLAAVARDDLLNKFLLSRSSPGRCCR